MVIWRYVFGQCGNDQVRGPPYRRGAARGIVADLAARIALQTLIDRVKVSALPLHARDVNRKLRNNTQISEMLNERGRIRVQQGVKQIKY